MPRTLRRIISKRFMATIYEGSFKKSPCVWKIEHVTKKDVDNRKSPMWAELNFSLDFGNKHPDHFMQLLHYEIGDCSKVKLSWDPNNYPKDWTVDNDINIIREQVCIHKAYSKMQVVLNDIYRKMNHLQIYSMILQMEYALKLMHANNYTHGDFHPGNIAAIKTKPNSKKKLGDVIVPTFGYDWKLIDFGLTRKTKNKKNEGDTNEFVSMFSTFISSTDDVWSDLIRTKEYISIKNISSDRAVIEPLFMTMFPEKYKSFSYGETLYPQCLPTDDLIFIAYHGADSKATHDYLLNKILT